MPMAQQAARRTQMRLDQSSSDPMPASLLFLLPGTNVRLPASSFLARRCGNCLDLRLLGFLGFPITSLLATGHVALPWFFDTLMGRTYFDGAARSAIAATLRPLRPNSHALLRLGPSRKIGHPA